MDQELAAFYTPEDRAAGVPEAEMREARERGCADDGRWHVRRDGSRFCGRGELRPIRDGGGAVASYPLAEAVGALARELLRSAFPEPWPAVAVARPARRAVAGRGAAPAQGRPGPDRARNLGRPARS